MSSSLNLKNTFGVNDLLNPHSVLLSTSYDNTLLTPQPGLVAIIVASYTLW